MQFDWKLLAVGCGVQVFFQEGEGTFWKFMHPVCFCFVSTTLLTD